MNSKADLLNELRIDRDATEVAAGGSGRWVALALVAIAITGAGLWWVWDRPLLVRVAVASAASVAVDARPSVLDASGYVVARRRATVSAKITGKVVEVLIEEGMRVAAGQLLARLDDSQARVLLSLAEAQLKRTRSALAETEVQLAEARRRERRTTELSSRGLASDADRDAVQAEVEALKARLATARDDIEVSAGAVELERQRLGDTLIRAPFDGVVIAKAAQPGEMISPISAGGGFTRTGICTIVDMDSLEVEVDVNEAYIDRVTAGQPVTARLDAYPDWRIPAEVIAIVPAADRQKATVRVRIGFRERDSRILPDMGIKVSFMEGEPEPAAAANTPPPGVEVPAGAIVERDATQVVFVLAGGRAERRAVRTVAIAGRTLIAAGVRAGERVIVDPPNELNEGDPVRVAES